MSEVEITIVKFRSYLMPDETVCDATWRTLKYPGATREVHEIYWTQGNFKQLHDSVVTYDPVRAGVEYAQMCDQLSDRLLDLRAKTPTHLIPDNYGSW